MRKLILLLTLLIASVCGSSQGLYLPSSAIDTIIWKLKIGVSCDSLQKAQFRQILALQNELMATGKLVTLLTSQNTLQDSIASAFQKEIAANRTLHKEEKRSLIRESMRLKKWVAGLGALDVALLLILLL